MTLLAIEQEAQRLNQERGNSASAAQSAEQQQRIQQREELVAQMVSGLPAEATALSEAQATQLILTTQALSYVPAELSPQSATGLIEVLASATECLLSGASDSGTTVQAAVDSVSSILETALDVRAAVSDAPIGVRMVLRSLGEVLVRRFPQQVAGNASASSDTSQTVRLQSAAVTLSVTRTPTESVGELDIALRGPTRLTRRRE